MKINQKSLSKCLLFMCLIIGFSVQANGPKTFINPVISGFHPDPSITRVGDDYYLANSTFEFFPGAPIFHSKDLVNWKLISYAVAKPEYLPELVSVKSGRGGIYAPTLRHHDGVFYMITTCVKCGDNFYVTATDPKGPWSKPIWVEGDRGIDPDLFWDDDGKVYYSGTGILDKSKAPWKGANGIWIQEIDLKTGKLFGERTQLTYGHGITAVYTEGPHIYKIDGKYILMVAEGGTGSSHAVTVFKSDNVRGPYEAFQNNPVVSHRNMGWKAFINSTGHADLIQTQNGEWWAVLLAKRAFKGTNMLARETFLVPVSIERGWPIFNPGIGQVLIEDRRPKLPWTPVKPEIVRDDFTGNELDLIYNTLRLPNMDWFELDKGKFNIALSPVQLTEPFANPSAMLRRTRDLVYTASTKLTLDSQSENEIAGITIYRNDTNFYQIVKNNKSVELAYWKKGKKTLVETKPYTKDTIVFKVDASADLKLSFSYGESEDSLSPIGGSITSRITSDNVALGFSGPFIGMYASSQGKPSSSVAQFDWFEYKGLDKKN